MKKYFSNNLLGFVQQNLMPSSLACDQGCHMRASYLDAYM